MFLFVEGAEQTHFGGSVQFVRIQVASVRLVPGLEAAIGDENPHDKGGMLVGDHHKSEVAPPTLVFRPNHAAARLKEILVGNAGLGRVDLVAPSHPGQTPTSVSCNLAAPRVIVSQKPMMFWVTFS